MQRLALEIRKKWQNYKYRFVPWQIFNWQHERSTIKRIKKSAEVEIGQDDEICENLKCLFEGFHHAEAIHKSLDGVMFESCGFTLEKKTSSIKGAGEGIFVSRGVVKEGAVAAMYPGTIYYPSDPLLIQSINNPFILRCIDGLMVDGNHRGISKLIYRSCCGRDMIGPYEPCDTSWLTDATKNPLAVGQFVNNQTAQQPANVAYHEVDIPISFPLHLRKFLPNIYYHNKFSSDPSGISDIGDTSEVVLLRVVVLLSISDIYACEELLSSYFTEVS